MLTQKYAQIPLSAQLMSVSWAKHTLTDSFNTTSIKRL